jgi:hypothetical protein
MFKTTKTTEEYRNDYRAARDRACFGDVFAGLPTPAKFDATVKARLAYFVGGATPAEWARAAHDVANEFVSDSNWREIRRAPMFGRI